MATTVDAVSERQKTQSAAPSKPMPAPDIPAPRPLPSDIHPRWLDLIRKIRSLCDDNNGNAIVQVNILVNANDEPVLWTVPRVVKIEPRRSSEVIGALLTELCRTD